MKFNNWDTNRQWRRVDVAVHKLLQFLKRVLVRIVNHLKHYVHRQP